jgi:hypothetical protein
LTPDVDDQDDVEGEPESSPLARLRESDLAARLTVPEDDASPALSDYWAAWGLRETPEVPDDEVVERRDAAVWVAFVTANVLAALVVVGRHLSDWMGTPMTLVEAVVAVAAVALTARIVIRTTAPIADFALDVPRGLDVGDVTSTLPALPGPGETDEQVATDGGVEEDD